MTSVTEPRTVEHLIVPLDESQESERALPIAIGFAERLAATAELIAVADTAARSDPLRERLIHLAHQSGTPVDSSAVLEGDDVAFEVGRRAASRPASVIVMSSHGPTRTSGVLTDSLAAELLADGLPVVVVGPHAVSRSSDLPIVACLDGSTDSERVIPLAATWASAMRVPLILLIVARPHLEGGPARLPGGAREAFDPERALQLAASEVNGRWPGLELRGQVVSYPWNVADALSMYLERHPAQLFAVATHIRSGWSRLIHPSATARIVHQLAAPVLVVPIEPAVAEEAEPAEPQPTELSEPAPARPERGVRPFREIIVPVDPDHIGVNAAVATANNLAVAGNATLTFLSCDVDPAHHVEKDRRRAELTELVRPTDARWKVVESADVSDAIIEAAASAPGSIVCLATAAPGQVIDTLMPTTTGQIVRWSPRTVVLVGPRCVPLEGAYREVVGCVDGSLISEAVAELTGFWARSFGLPARILQVVEPAARIAGSTPVAGRYVERLAARVARYHGIPAMGETIDDADPASAIRGWADAHPEALLVMASHGAGLSENVLGGVVMDVVRHVPTPIAVVPAHPIGERITHPSSAAGWAREDRY